MNPERRRFRTLIAAFGALVYALFGLRIFLSSLASVIVAVRDAAAPNGGVAAVSFALDVIFLPYALLAIAAVIANVMLRSWARGADSRARTLHRTQRWSIVLAFAVMLAVPALMSMNSPWGVGLFPLTALVWGASFVVTAALLGLYALRSR